MDKFTALMITIRAKKHECEEISKETDCSKHSLEEHNKAVHNLDAYSELLEYCENMKVEG